MEYRAEPPQWRRIWVGAGRDLPLKWLIEWRCWMRSKMSCQTTCAVWLAERDAFRAALVYIGGVSSQQCRWCLQGVRSPLSQPHGSGAWRLEENTAPHWTRECEKLTSTAWDAGTTFGCGQEPKSAEVLCSGTEVLSLCMVYTTQPTDLCTKMVPRMWELATFRLLGFLISYWLVLKIYKIEVTDNMVWAPYWPLPWL